LATALLFDCFGDDFIKSIRKVVLIEPSELALRRAEAIEQRLTFEGRSSRFRDLEKAIGDPQFHNWFAVQQTHFWQFECGNRKPAIAWVLETEVIDGPF
jgi:hypothetical protein